MDVLRPPLVWIEGRCYRKYPVASNKNDQEEEERFTELMDFECCDEPENNNYEIETLDNGQYRAVLKVPSAYFGNIIGAKGVVKKRLESETNTHIRIPYQGSHGDITVTGNSKRNIASALNRIDLIVDSARQKQAFTHFISIPLTNPQMKESLLSFQNDVLKECKGCRGINSSIFQNPNKLHLTIGTMPLVDQFERQKALEILNECKEFVSEILQGKPLVICVEGIEYMNDDPAEVDILYAKVKCTDGSDRLQMLADQLVRKFVGKGIMQKQYERVKLHTTVMNTLFRKDNSGITEMNHHRGARQRESFDASTILEIFQNYYFGEFPLENIQLSQRYSTGKEGYYSCSGKIDL